MTRDVSKLLVLAEERVARAEEHIRKYRAIVEPLRDLGRDTTDADAVLREFELRQAYLIAERDRLRRELEQTA